MENLEWEEKDLEEVKETKTPKIKENDATNEKNEKDVINEMSDNYENQSKSICMKFLEKMGYKGGGVVAIDEKGKPDTLISLEELRELIRQRIPDEGPISSPQTEEGYDQPLQLLRPTLGHERLELNELVLERLASIEDPLAIVAVVGPYHGGKSFLLNVLLNSTLGFPVSARPEPETRGIWIRIVPKSKLKGVDGSQSYPYILKKNRGDRTLDTLFTHGISCYTLRTPADLNNLRERYGNKGLAAEEELFYNLHPKYLQDIENLRTAVFGNLTAKGGEKLTGKRVARLLPILVHYVNKDFPLSADRKLSDVLVDIIIDGAFSGGVQYFEKEMKAAFPQPEKVKFSRRNLSSAPENLESLSALAMSALTTHELNEILAAAEMKAIDYCKRRCVGVPLALISSTCDASLGVKIDRLKPLYREKNEHQVREVLVQLGETLREKAEKILFNIHLPIRESEIQENCNHVIKDALQNGKAAYQSAFNEAFSSAIDDYMSQEQKMRAAATSVNDNERQSRPLSPRKLAEVHSTSLKAAQEAYDKAVKGGGLSWIGPGNELYDFHQFQCLQWSKQQYSDRQVRSNAEILVFCEKLVSGIAHRYKELVSKITPFPDNDEIISGKADVISKQLVEEYVSMTKEYASPAVEEKQKELIQIIEVARAHLIRKNTALMAAYCYDPLMDAYRELRMEDCERTVHNILVSWSIWSLKCLWPGPRYTFGFKYSAYTTARKHLEKAQASAKHESKLHTSSHDIAKGVILSPATQNKVIQAWIEHDLARHANVVLVNFSCIVTFIVVVVTAFLYIRKQTLSGRSFQNTHNWSSHDGRFNWKQTDYHG